MKLNDVISEQRDIISEIPAGGLRQAGKKIGSRVLNKLPGNAAKSKAANLAGQADLGDTANNLHKEFNTFLGTQGKKLPHATGEDLRAFLKQKNHNTKATIPSGVLQKQQVDSILTTAAKEALAGQGGIPRQEPQQQGTTQQTTVIPPELQDTINNLSAQERQQLLRLL